MTINAVGSSAWKDSMERMQPTWKLMVIGKSNKLDSFHVFDMKPNHVLSDPCAICTARAGSFVIVCKCTLCYSPPTPRM